MHRRLVIGIVTQDRSQLTQWVTSYHVQYYNDTTYTWEYVSDDAGTILVRCLL